VSGDSSSNTDKVLRAAINISMFCAAPHKALPTAKKTMAMSMTGLRPKISARAPESGRMTVLARAYAAPTQTNLSPPLRSWVIVGSAVLMTERSRALRNRETATDKKVIQNVVPLPGFRVLGTLLIGVDGNVTVMGSEGDMMVWKVKTSESGTSINVS
jgi:hypothetical protein